MQSAFSFWWYFKKFWMYILSYWKCHMPESASIKWLEIKLGEGYFPNQITFSFKYKASFTFNWRSVTDELTKSHPQPPKWTQKKATISIQNGRIVQRHDKCEKSITVHAPVYKVFEFSNCFRNNDLRVCRCHKQTADKAKCLCYLMSFD